jgi:hypothetical protein
MIRMTVRCSVALVLAHCIAAPLGAQGATGRLEGIVTDSVHSAPVVGTAVTLTPLEPATGNPAVARTDRHGHYLFEALAPGRYSVSFESALLDSLEFGVVPVVATIAPAASAKADLAIPSGATLRAAACPGNGLPQWTGALLGVVTDVGTGKPLVDAQISVSWTELTVDSAARDVAPRPRVIRTATNATGQYRVCGLPTEERLDVNVEHAGAIGPTHRMLVHDAEGVLVRNFSFRRVSTNSNGGVVRQEIENAPAGNASIAGKVSRADGSPIVGAQLRLVSGASLARTDDKGEFVLTALPSGTHELEVRHLGYGVVRRSVELTGNQRVRENIVMERVVSLDSVRVVATRVRFPEFERNRLRFPGGVFMNEEDIARRGFRTLPLMITNVPGFRLVSQSRGRIGIQSNRLRQCQTGQAGFERLDAINLVVDNMEHMEVTDVHFPEVAAIEVYYNGDKAPLKYARACSVIVVWTKYIARRYGRDDSRREP